MKTRKQLSLRTSLQLLFLGGATYVVAVSVYIALVIGPVSGRLQRQTAGIIGEFEVLQRNADSLTALATSALAAANVGADSALAVLEATVLDSLAGHVLQSTALLTGMPLEMRQALTVAAAKEAGLVGILYEARSQLQVERDEAALVRIAIADSLARDLTVALGDAQLAGLVDLLNKQQDLGSRASKIVRLVAIWVVLGAVLLPIGLARLRRRLHGPLGDLDRGLRSLARGDYPSLEVRFDDEIGRLTEHFNELVPMLQMEAKRARGVTERLGRVLNESFNEIYVVEPESLQLLQANASAARNLGYQETELLQQTLSDIAPDLPKDQIYALAHPESGQALHGAIGTEFRRRDGSVYPVELAVQLSEVESPPVLLIIALDTSELREREEQLRQAQKMEAVGQLTGGVAHDFNNLLAVIMGNIELIEEELPAGSELHKMSRQVLEAAESGASLTQRLLAFSRRQTLHPQVLDLNRMVTGMTDLIARTLGETIAVETIGAGALWKCEADPSQLENVLLNLAINGRDAMPDGGNLTIETSNARLDDEYAEAEGVESGQYVLLAVTDNGIGMPAAIADQAFDPFFTTKDVGKGSGLGLSQVYGVVRQSQGHVKIYSEVGQGTTVKVYLPRSHQPEDPPRSRRPGRTTAAAGETVFVIEDNAEVRDYVGVVLRKLGYSPVVFADARSALGAAANRDQVIDVVLTDVVLGGEMNGVELAQEIVAVRPEVKVLFMSGYTENAIAHGGKLDQGVELLEKPFHKDALARKLRKILDDRTP